MIASAPANLLPAVGIHRDVPAEIYHSWNAASNSRLMLLDRSPAHMLESIKNPAPRTPALILGDAMHLCALQPELFFNRYIVAGKCVARLKKDGSACKNSGIALVDGDWFCGVHVPSDKLEDMRSIISQDDYDRCQRMRDAVAMHPVASAIIEKAASKNWPGNEDGGTEVSAIWKCSTTGALCKLRADILWPRKDALVADLKTTEDGSPRAFARSIDQHGYAFQGAHYTSGLAALDWPVNDFIFIAVEKEPPHGVAVYRLRDDVLDVARETVLRRLTVYQRCIESGEYPCYSQQIEDIGISDWSLGQLERANRSLEVV